MKQKLIRWAVGLALAAAWAAGPAARVEAAGVVTNCANDSQLIAKLAGGGLVTFNCGGTHAPATITLSMDYDLAVDATIDGFNGGHPVTLDGINFTRLFSVDSGRKLTLANLTLMRGAGIQGSCVYDSGTLELDNVELTDCHATPTYAGGGLYVDGTGSATLLNARVHDNSAGGAGGGVYSAGTLTVTNSLFMHNSAVTDGGGVWTGGAARISGSTFYSNTASAFGGGVYNEGQLTLTTTTLDQNLAEASGGGLANFTGGTATVSRATFSRNVSHASGGGLLVFYGGATLTNVTLSGNQSSLYGGGVYNANSATTLSYATLSANGAPNGGNLYQYGTVGSKPLTVQNSLLDHGLPGGNCTETAVSGSHITSGGYNLSSDGTCSSFFNLTGDLNGQTLHLGPLADNGGPTRTLLPGALSPALDAIPNATNGCGTLTTIDQRGAPRPIHGLCDIGAVEAGWVHAELWLAMVRR